MSTSITLDTPVAELHSHIARLGPTTSAKLAIALAATEDKQTDDITVDDLLHYLPMRYEDRASLVRIADLEDGMEASLELYVKLAGGYEVRNRRSYKQRLFIFDISGTDRDRT